MENLIIRKAKISDLSDLKKVAVATFSETYKAKNTPENFKQYIYRAFNEKQLLSEIQNLKSHFYLVMNDDQIIGYLKLNEPAVQTDRYLEGTLEIERIYVTKSFHGQGIGRLLIEKSVDVAKMLGLKILWLGVWEENPDAIAFYEKMGFVEVGTHIFRVGDDDQLDYVLEKSV